MHSVMQNSSPTRMHLNATTGSSTPKPRTHLRNPGVAAMHAPGLMEMDEHAPLRFALVFLVVSVGIAIYVFCTFYKSEEKDRGEIMYQALSTKDNDTSLTAEYKFCVEMNAVKTSQEDEDSSDSFVDALQT
uniref:Uncharacterized protein n=1 Tax=Ditylenchus dipsaci TaxID=166011 RepID=A0A915DDP0_9BILA